MDPWLLAFFVSGASGLMTALGSSVVLIGWQPSQRHTNILLGFAAGVMLAAAFFSLIVPALEIASNLYGDGIIPPLMAVTGILAGALLIAFIDKTVPHEHFIKGTEGPSRDSIQEDERENRCDAAKTNHPECRRNERQ